mgnify:FL=1
MSKKAINKGNPDNINKPIEYKSRKVIAFFMELYYNLSCKKNLPFKNFFYITPYLIIYTPLEIPDSSPVGDFFLSEYSFFKNLNKVLKISHNN